MNILVVGFFGEGNLGDEAILEGIALSAGPVHNLIVTSAKRQDRQNISTIPRKGLSSWPAFLGALRKSGRVVFTGGLLQDWTFEGVTFYALRMLASRFAGKPPGLWGVGIGPLRKKGFQALARKALLASGPVWTRDPESAELFRRLTGRPAGLGTDWSWAIPTPSPSRSRGSEGLVGVNLRPWCDGSIRETAISRLREVHANGGLVGLPAREEDSRLMDRCFPGISTCRPTGFQDLVGFCRGLREGWAMRYHVLLAMLRANIPVVPLPYDPKVVSLCLEAGIHEVSGEPSPMQSRPEFVLTARNRLVAMSEAFLAHSGRNRG